MTRKRRHRKADNLPRILITGGVLVLAAIVLWVKVIGENQAQATVASVALPAEQLENALAEGRPTLAFFHSNSCRQCIDMIGIVNQVYPEFDHSVVLVDVNIYDERNEPLLQQVGLRYIPTLIFYDRAGQEQVSVGVMQSEELHQTLIALAAGE